MMWQQCDQVVTQRAHRTIVSCIKPDNELGVWRGHRSKCDVNHAFFTAAAALLHATAVCFGRSSGNTNHLVFRMRHRGIAGAPGRHGCIAHTPANTCRSRFELLAPQGPRLVTRADDSHAGAPQAVRSAAETNTPHCEHGENVGTHTHARTQHSTTRLFSVVYRAND